MYTVGIVEIRFFRIMRAILQIIIIFICSDNSNYTWII